MASVATIIVSLTVSYYTSRICIIICADLKSIEMSNYCFYIRGACILLYFHPQFNDTDIILPVSTAYFSLVPNNDPQIFTDSTKPFMFEELTIQRGINYTVTGFGENIIGNGSTTSTVICMCW